MKNATNKINIKTNIKTNTTNIEKYRQLYNIYSKMFNNNICVLHNDSESGMFYNFVNANKIYKIIHSDLNLFYVPNINQHIYKTSFKHSQLAKNIHLLLDNESSVILINNNYNVIAIHHPANKYNTYFIPF